MKKTNAQLAKFLESGLFYEPFNVVAELLKTPNHLRSPIKILYGETYDEYGLTVDSLKYYFLMHYLKLFLEKTGLKVETDILVGDVSSLRNKAVGSKDKVSAQIQRNLELIQKIIKTYNLDLNIKLMSNVVTEDSYQKRKEKIAYIFQTDPLVQEILPKTVLQNRITQEKQTNYLYTQEEVALILPYDIKVGPPREVYYDTIAQKFASQFDLNGPVGLYAKPTYPLGQHFAFFLSHKEIEEFGVTPYKAGSNQMQQYRVILEQTSIDQLELLINTSYHPSNPTAANPVFDLFTITEMAKNLIENTIPDFTRFDQYKSIPTATVYQFHQFILKPLNLL